MKPEDFIMMPIPAASYTAICALLGGVLAAASTGNAPKGSAQHPGDGDIAAAPTPAAEQQAPAGAEASPPASDPDDIDAAGWPWSPDLHASTKGKTKDGFWRMKVGVARPDPKPGFPKADANADTGTSSATSTNSATSQGATEQAQGQPATSQPPAAEEPEDEFAAFRAAAENSNANDAAAAASVPARQYSDADLGSLCNQAAVKLGDPNPIKEIIARYVPEGQVAHSRNIQPERRADFVREVEEKAGVQFAG